jgi:hypothetical protein
LEQIIAVLLQPMPHEWETRELFTKSRESRLISQLGRLGCHQLH